MWTPEQWVAVLGSVAVVIGAMARLVRMLGEAIVRIRDLGDQLHSHDQASQARLRLHDLSSRDRLEAHEQASQERARALNGSQKETDELPAGS